MSNENVKPVFLNDRKLLSWYIPYPPGAENSPSIYNRGGTTRIKKQLGKDTIDESVGVFHVTASAVKYLADIARFRVNIEEMKTSEEVLFDGGIVILQRGEIPGTKIYGEYTIVSHGRIWFARLSESFMKPAELGPSDIIRASLRDILFGVAKSELDSEKRVQRIVNGYKRQE